MQQSESLVPALNGHLINLSFEGQSVRIIERNGEPWFLSNDVGLALDLANIRDWVYKLDEDQKLSLHGDSLPGLRANTTVISESGLYELIFRSSKPEAKRFRKWVTAEVLPQIRRTGGYGTQASPQARLELALADIAREHESRIGELEAHMRPGPDWLTVGDYCDEHLPGVPMNGGRRAKLGLLAANKSAVLRLPVGSTKRARNYMRTYAPAALDAAYGAVRLSWLRKDAAAAKQGTYMEILSAAGGNEAARESVARLAEVMSQSQPLALSQA